MRRNQIIIDLVLIHKVKKVKAFSLFLFLGGFASYIGKNLLEMSVIFFCDCTLEAVITLSV